MWVCFHQFFWVFKCKFLNYFIPLVFLFFSFCNCYWNSWIRLIIILLFHYLILSSIFCFLALLFCIMVNFLYFLSKLSTEVFFLTFISIFKRSINIYSLLPLWTASNSNSWRQILRLGAGAKRTGQLKGNKLPGQEEAAAAAKSLQSCPTPCNPIDGSPQALL